MPCTARCIDADEDLQKNYFNAAANSHLTGVKLAQLQDSLAWQEFFHKLGSYLLKIQLIPNTLKNIDEGKLAITDESSASDVVNRLDTLANALKNAADIVNDLAKSVNDIANAASSVPDSLGPKDRFNIQVTVVPLLAPVRLRATG